MTAGFVLPLFDRTPSDKIVIGLGFGDEGKGMTVAYETARVLAFGGRPVNIRFNGGPQAAHNVRIARYDGTVAHHTHSQFGSGAMLGATTVMTEGMLVNPLAIAPEATHLQEVSGIDVMSRLVIDSLCPVLLPMHTEANRECELSRQRHGSTGTGVGIARWCEDEESGDDTIRVMDLFDWTTLRDKMGCWHERICKRFGVDIDLPTAEFAQELSDGMMQLVAKGLRVCSTRDYLAMLKSQGWCTFICEGSQGVMLDEHFGFFPHVTYGRMTGFGVPYDIRKHATIVGVTRSYATRHGHGPFPVHGAHSDPTELDNVTSEWAGDFRSGTLDMTLLYEGWFHSRAKEIVVSCLDRYPGRYSYNYRSDGMVRNSDEQRLLDEISKRCAPVTVTGRGNALDMWKDRKED